MKVILWEVDPLDWKYRNSEHVQSEILKQTQPGAIILVHDIHATSVEAMPATLDALLAKGYKFVTVPELIAMDHPKPKPSPTATPAPAPGVKSRIRAVKALGRLAHRAGVPEHSAPMSEPLVIAGA